MVHRCCFLARAAGSRGHGRAGSGAGGADGTCERGKPRSRDGKPGSLGIKRMGHGGGRACGGGPGGGDGDERRGPGRGGGLGRTSGGEREQD